MTATPDAAAPAADGMEPEHRLHPMSWLFVLLQQLRHFVIPLLALLFFGRGDRNAPYSLTVVGILVLYAVWRYWTYRYRITADSVLIRSGVLNRTLRQIPFSRIHNVALHQSLLHRLFGVAEVRLESAGGHRPEAEMRVLKLADATRLEALVRRQTAAQDAHVDAHGAEAGSIASAVAPDPSRGRLLLALSAHDVLRLGLISNRGMIVLGAAIVAVSQLDPQLPPDVSARWGQALNAFFGQHFGVVDIAVMAILAIAAFFVFLRLLSTLLALQQYSGFRLEQHGRRLTVERGLLTRVRTSVSRRRIQAFLLEETLLHRVFRRRTLKVDTAVIGHHHDERGFRELAPVATPQACDALVGHLLPGSDWPPPQWRPLHARATWRLAMPGTLLALLAAAALGWRHGAWGALALAWIPWTWFVAHQHAKRAGYVVDAALVAVRTGWWSRRWRFAELGKLQALSLHRSPLDRMSGMATLWLDTAGAGAHPSALRIRYLPVAEAAALLDRLGHAVARKPLRW